MVDSVLKTPESTLLVPGPSLVVTAWELANGNLLRDNVFRGLGLSVLATGREISKRAEEFRLARELDAELARWAFAPATLLPIERTRAALQNLSDPFRRMLAEIFWYWPALYPESGEDESLRLLAANEADQAIAYWAERQSSGEVVVFHNLAVYHLMMALELETTATSAQADELTAWWEAAIRFWQLAIEHDEFWQRIERRVNLIADPQMKVESVALLRGVFPDILGGINGSLALKAVEANDQRTAARHVVLLGRVYESPELLDAALARSVRSVVRRIDARVAEAYRLLENAGEGLKISRALIEHSAQDIHCLNTLCGPDSAVATSAAVDVTKVILETAAGAKASAGKESTALVALAYAHGLRKGSEVESRVEDFYKAALNQAVRALGAANAEPVYAKLYTVVAEQLLSEWQRWDLPAAGRQLIADEIADQLREIARQALAERDDIAFAMHAYHLLLQLPCDESETQRRQSEKEQLQQEYSARIDHAITLVHESHRFRLDHRGLQWDEQHWPIESVNALRFGAITLMASRDRKRVVALRVDKTELILDERNFFRGLAAAETYARVVLALEYFIVPALVRHLVKEIRRGELLLFDELTVSRDEVLIPAAGRLRGQPISVSHRQLQHRTENDTWTVSAGEGGTWKRKYLIVDTWNAVIMGRLIATLAEEIPLSSSNE